MDLRLYPLQEDDFDKIINLGERVHGKNYLDHAHLEEIYRKSCSQDKCCSYVLYDKPRSRDGKLVGFRLTYAPGSWEPDKWCSVEDWNTDPNRVCYFKSVTIDSDYRGLGIGPYLLDVSIQTVKQLGGEAGVTHIWMQSPGNTAFKYFTKSGGRLVKIWPSRWNEDSVNDGYICVVCGNNCHCDAAEMILHFGETRL